MKFSRLALLGCTLIAGAHFTALAADPVVTGDARVDHLLARMTLDEKLTLIRGAAEDPATSQDQAGYLAGVPRLGIPSLRLSDGPPGVLTRLPSQAETATMGLAATFSTTDAKANGVVIGREAKSLGIDVVLEPFINIDRDITFGRAYNTYGEDPLLTGIIAANLIQGIQGQDIMAQAKHYVGYDTAGSHVVIDPQALHEIYVAPFRDAVNAGVSSIMCSYNTINGSYACGNRGNLTTILRGELGFKGFVTSDWGAVHSPDFIDDGLDMEMPGAVDKSSPMASLMFSFFSLDKPQPAVAKPNMAAIAGLIGGNLPEEPGASPSLGGFGGSDLREDFWSLQQAGKLDDAAITRAAGRVLYEIDRFGYLDHPPSHQIMPHATEANAAIIEKTAIDAAVLLKNDDRTLPLKSSDLDSIAMIGPGAAQVVAIGTAGERSVGFVERQVGPFDALCRLSGGRPVLVVADDMAGVAIPAANFSHDGKPGLLRADGSADANIDFTVKSGHALAVNYASGWSGTLSVLQAGSYWINLQLLGAGGSLVIDGKPVASAGGSGTMHGDTVLAGKNGLLPTPDGLDNLRAAVTLAAGPHKIAVTLKGDGSDLPEQVRLAWSTPDQRAANRAAAIAAAKAAKVAVVFAWSRGRPDFALPGDQDQLIEDIAAVNPNTVVVLNVSQPVAMPWLGSVKSVLQMWWPGDEGGWATAKLLLGKNSPAGRLPFTWGKQLTDYPATDPVHPERSAAGVNGVTNFSEGIYVGYRWFDQQKIAPLYPFGYGLSYSSFAYSGLKLKPAADGGIDAGFTLTNTGGVASDEVPQVYLGAPGQGVPGAQFAVHALAGFARVHLAPGASKNVSIHIAPRALQYWSDQSQSWQTAAGPREVLVGGSSRDLPLSGQVQPGAE